MNKETFKSKLNNINIVERYKDLCIAFNDKNNDLLGNHHNVYLKYLEKYGYDIEASKRESFFRFNIQIDSELSLGMQFVLKDGLVETVLGISVNDVVIMPSGRIDFMPMQMGVKFDRKLYNLPAYKTFDELGIILDVLFDIFEDLKKEVML